MEKSKIQWTDATVNFWMGCKKVSDACKNCYMFRDMDKYGLNPKIIQRTKDGTFKAALKWKEPKRIFTCSWSDFFIEEADEYRAEAWDVIRNCKHHKWMILTKRPERIRKCLPADWGDGWDHVWIGVSVESEKYMGRAETLVNLPIKTRFISAEPLLSEIDFTKFPETMKSIDWVIIGGESGNEVGPYKYRECKIEWIEKIVADLKAMEIATFVKQMGSHLAKELGYDKYSYGGLVEEWPTHLQVRDFPYLTFASMVKPKFDAPKIYTAADLLAMEVTEVPMLITNMMEKQAIGFLAGGSDVGKSLLGLTIAVAICSEQKDLFGFAIQKDHSKAIIVSTEDSPTHLSVRLKNILDGTEMHKDNLRLLFGPDKNIVQTLRKCLQEQKVDLIYMDTFRDLFRGDINSAIAISIFLEPYKELVEEFGCTIIFNHHISKAREFINQPNKNDMSGSEALQSSTRMVLQLNKKPDGKRILTVTKGNNIADSVKQVGIELEIVEPGEYQVTGKSVIATSPAKKLENDAVIKAKILNLASAGKSGRAIAEELQKEGIPVGKTKVCEIIKECPKVEIPDKPADGQQEAA